jgi:dihydroorotase
MDVSRRDFLRTTAAAAGAVSVSAPPRTAAMPSQLAQAGTPVPRGFNPADATLKYDLVLAGGDVLDPSQKLRARRDIGIKHRQISAVASSIPADRAIQRIDVTGKLVTPAEVVK